MYDHGGTREVEPRATSLERDEENGRVVLVELVDELNALSFGSRAGNRVVRDAVLVQTGGDDVEELHELGEHKGLLARIVSALDELDDGFELRGPSLVVLEEQGRIAAQFAQARDFGEYGDLVGAERLARTRIDGLAQALLERTV